MHASAGKHPAEGKNEMVTAAGREGGREGAPLFDLATDSIRVKLGESKGRGAILLAYTLGLEKGPEEVCHENGHEENRLPFRSLFLDPPSPFHFLTTSD